MRVECPIYYLAHHDPEKIAVQTEKRSYTYFEFNLYVESIKNHLIHLNFKSGDILPICESPKYEVVCLIVACFRLGLVIYPLNHRFPDHYLTELLSYVYVSTMVSSRRLDSVTSILSDSLLSSTPGSSDPIFYEGDKLSTLLLTSGSSGMPKIAGHTFNHHLMSAQVSNAVLNFSSLDTWLLSLPLSHVSGISILFRVFFGKGTLVISDIHSELGKQVSFLSLIPTQFYRLQQSFLDHQFPSLSTILLGGAPIPHAITLFCLKHHLPLVQTYGMTEFSSQIALKYLNSDVYKPLDHVQIDLSEKGTLLIKGDSLFKGYYHKGSFDQKLDDKGWFDTGDRIKLHDYHLDNKHTFEILGRIDHMFISGGENIQPEEIETVILQLEDVLDCRVIGIPDEEFGHVAIAFVEMKSFDESSLLKKMALLLPKFKCPKRIYDLKIVRSSVLSLNTSMNASLNSSLKPNRSDLYSFLTLVNHQS